jgi:hypothetical protein
MFMTPYDYIIATGWNRRISFWIDSHALNAVCGLPQTQVTNYRMMKNDHTRNYVFEISFLCFAEHMALATYVS